MKGAPELAIESVANRGAEMYRGPLRRILVLSPLFPYPPTNGIALRIWAILESLASNGHSVDLLCFGEAAADVRAPEVRRVCSSVEVIPHVTSGIAQARDVKGRLRVLLSRLPYGVARARSQQMRSQIRSRIDAEACDALLVEETYLLANLPEPCSLPLAIDHHNSEYALVRRYLRYERNPLRLAYAWLEARKLRGWENRATRRADVVLTCSEVDRAIFQRLAPDTPSLVAPNVVDVDKYDAARPMKENRILYTGGMDWYPNRDAVEYFVRQILPSIRASVRGVRFVIAGRNPPDTFRRSFADLGDVDFTGTVGDMREEIAKAAVCVVPLRIGSGTRLKILEAAAMAKPVVSTSVGAEGLNFRNGREIILADKPEPFAHAVVKFLENEDQRNSIGRAARERVRTSYSLEALRSPLVAMISQLERAHAPRA